MKKKEKQTLIQEYGLLRNEFLKVVKNDMINVSSGFPKIDTPYLCRIIKKVFGSDSVIANHFHSVLQSFGEAAPKTYEALREQDGSLSKEDVFAPFHYEEVKLRLMLIDEIIESLS